MKLIWTKEKCREESLKYKSRKEFSIKSVSAYNAAQRKKWLDDICSHMVEIKKPKGYWTKEKCQEEALKYDTTKDFRKYSVTAYDICVTNNWYDEMCSHMVKSERKIFWTKERCSEEALKYKNRINFCHNSCSAYNKSLKKGWLNEICLHMSSSQKPSGYWTKEKCQEEALKYDNKKDFYIKSTSAYYKSSREKWLKDLR